MKIAVSFLKSNQDIENTIKDLDKSTCDYIHVDVMDGRFVDPITLLVKDLDKYLGDTKKELDVHLMVKEPTKYFPKLALLNTAYVTIHHEIGTNIKRRLNAIRQYKMKCGVAINPDTKVEDIQDLLPLVDQVLVMTVKPGKGGQKLIPDCVSKINELAKLRKKNNYSYIISADGGINDTNINDLKKRGLDMVAVGSFVCMKNNYDEQINKLKKVKRTSKK